MMMEEKCVQTEGFGPNVENVDTSAGLVPDVVDTGYSFMGSCKAPWIWKSEDGRSWPMPCGKCLACRIRRRSVWTIRMLHEISKCEESCFITLTYDDENLPLRKGDENGILVKNDLQNFFKRLRKKYRNVKFKYYACGEYGERFSRPHYHAVIFGLRPEKVVLENVWGLGIVDIGDAEEASIRYVAGYVSKKLGLQDYYRGSRPAPFQLSSQGIGMEWAKENMVETLLEGFLTYRGRRLPVPRAYYLMYEKLFPEAADGFSARKSFESDLALTDTILEMAPQYGGRSWVQLTQDERENVLIQLHKRGKAIDDDLRSAERMREYKL